MKKLLILIAFLGIAAMTNAQILWPAGSHSAITGTPVAGALSPDSMNIATNIYNNLTIVTATIDTNATVYVTNISSELRTGARLIFRLTQSGGNADTVTWSTGLTGATTPLVAGKKKYIEFIYTGTALEKINEQQTD